LRWLGLRLLRGHRLVLVLVTCLAPVFGLFHDFQK
jgi:hypothetical protein